MRQARIRGGVRTIEKTPCRRVPPVAVRPDRLCAPGRSGVRQKGLVMKASDIPLIDSRQDLDALCGAGQGPVVGLWATTLVNDNTARRADRLFSDLQGAAPPADPPAAPGKPRGAVPGGKSACLCGKRLPRPAHRQYADPYVQARGFSRQDHDPAACAFGADAEPAFLLGGLSGHPHTRCRALRLRRLPPFLQALCGQDAYAAAGRLSQERSALRRRPPSGARALQAGQLFSALEAAARHQGGSAGRALDRAHRTLFQRIPRLGVHPAAAGKPA